MAASPTRGGTPSIVLRGTPDNLVGMLDLVNDTKGERRFRSLRLCEASLAMPDRPGLRRLALRQHLPGGSRRQVPVQFTVDPTTPPGSYEAMFEGEHGQHRATLEVLPLRRLGILPNRFEVEAAPGEVARVPVVLSNGGNVPLELSVLGVMVLEEQQQVCLSLQHALNAAKGKDYETFLNAFVTNLADKKADFLRVRVAGEGIVLQPGQSATGEIELHVPANAQAGRTYQARMAVLNQPLFLKLQTRRTGPTLA